MERIQQWIIGVLLMGSMLGITQSAQGADRSGRTVHPWMHLITQATALGLPTGFLQEIDPNFVTMSFEDLRTYAAEYHPADHRMILNMRLSFNSAGGVLMDLNRMSHHDLSLLYHELLHAYLDYIFYESDLPSLSPQATRVLTFAKEQLQCHFRFVRITPLRQRRDVTEMRFLSTDDAWEVLNETWALFVGWHIWTQLEQQQGNTSIGPWTTTLVEDWAMRLATASRNGTLLGYYEPDDPAERQITRKRFIAPSHGITPDGAKLLLDAILEEPHDIVTRGRAIIQATQDPSIEPLPCDFSSPNTAEEDNGKAQHLH